MSESYRTIKARAVGHAMDAPTANASEGLILGLVLLILLPIVAEAQTNLCLDSCRAMALRHNKMLSASRIKKDMAGWQLKAAKTAYLPKLDVAGGYEYTSRQVSLLNNDQKTALSSLGTAVSGSSSQLGTNLIQQMVQNGLLTSQQAQFLGTASSQLSGSMTSALNAAGQEIVDAFDTDTKHMFLVSAMVRQPIYMGGAITAANHMAQISVEMADNSIDAMTQTTLYTVDNAFWTVVSLQHKHELASQYLELLQKLDSDIQKMIEEGVATKAQGLTVDVKVNEAEIQLLQVENGLSLAKMLLCQTCGLPAESDINAQEDSNLASEAEAIMAQNKAENSDLMGVDRPELRLLQNAVDLSKETTKLTRAAYLPQVALTGGYLMTNPSIYNGFERKFKGVWNVGVMVRIPVWNWFEGTYKVRASKAATAIAQLDMEELNDKIDLQVSQSRHKLNEACRRLELSKRNVASADENLRCANLGFAEGVMQSTEVTEAQTAWLAAHTQQIDAEIDVHMASVNLNKALGQLK